MKKKLFHRKLSYKQLANRTKSHVKKFPDKRELFELLRPGLWAIIGRNR